MGDFTDSTHNQETVRTWCSMKCCRLWFNMTCQHHGLLLELTQLNLQTCCSTELSRISGSTAAGNISWSTTKQLYVHWVEAQVEVSSTWVVKNQLLAVWGALPGTAEHSSSLHHTAGGRVGSRCSNENIWAEERKQSHHQTTANVRAPTHWKQTQTSDLGTKLTETRAY